MWFVTWQEVLNNEMRVSWGCDEDESRVVMRVQENKGKIKVQRMTSGSFKPKDVLQA